MDYDLEYIDVQSRIRRVNSRFVGCTFLCVFVEPLAETMDIAFCSRLFIDVRDLTVVTAKVVISILV